MPSELVSAALGAAYSDKRRALHEAGGANEGEYIRAILKNAGVNTAAPWCAAWVQDIYDAAAEATGKSNPLNGVKQQAYVPSYAQWAKANGRIVHPEDSQAGDLVLFNFGGQRWDHIGIVTKPPRGTSKPMTFETIEGNTNDDGSREGKEVAARTRTLVDGRTMFVRVA